MNDVRAAIECLKSYSYYLNKHQYKTLKGQILHGDIDAAMKGLDKIMRAKGH